MSGTAFTGIAGIGRGSDTSWNDGASLTEGLLVGGIQGFVDSLSYFAGVKLGNVTLGNGTSILSKIKTYIFRVSADSTDGFVNAIIQTPIQRIYKEDSIGDIFKSNGGWKNVLATTILAGGFSALFQGIDIKNNNKLKTNVSAKEIERVIDNVHGYQLNISDLDDFYKSKLKQGFFTQEQIDNILLDINNKGYLSPETGSYLKNLLDDNYDIYVKTVNSADLDSIMEKGIYCNGTSTSIGGGMPTNIKDINLNNTITKTNDMLSIVNTIKTANGLSQGLNPIDGTIILKIPKGAKIEDIVIKSGDIFTIDPKYIDGYVGVDAKGNVGKYQLK